MQPLELADVDKMVADLLHSGETAALSELVYEKTKGNPFFTISFLTKLHQAGLIVRRALHHLTHIHTQALNDLYNTLCLAGQWFDHERGCWLWNLEKVRAMDYTDNVVEFMAQDLRNLPKEVRTYP
jgi:predicted ATPase